MIKTIILALGVLITSFGISNAACQSISNSINCDLVPGVISVITGAKIHAVLTNNTNKVLQINKVVAVPSHNVGFMEFCISRNTWATKQVAPGDGETECTNKNSGIYKTLTWGVGQGLLVRPGDKVFLADHSGPYVPHTFTVTVTQANLPVVNWRQPRNDENHQCNNKLQNTTMTPWKNTSNKTLTVNGIYVYVTNNRVRNACAYIKDVAGKLKWSQCGFNTNGLFSFTPQTLKPGESLSAQASNTCVGHRWDWAGYIIVK